MLKLIILTEKTVTECTPEYSTTMIPYSSITLYANCITRAIPVANPPGCFTQQSPVFAMHLFLPHSAQIGTF
jgi:hypothetical protein